MKTTFGLLFAVIGLASANAAVISWSSQAYTTHGGYGQFLDTGLFDTTGTQILAENVGGGATSFDGIEFSAGTISFVPGGEAGVFHDQKVPSPDLSRYGAYGNGGPGVVSLTGLIIGQQYRIQALVFDGRNDTGIPGRTISFDGINQGQYASGVFNVTWGDGLLVTGTFVADDLDQDFTIEAFLGSNSKGAQLNALLVHQIPEPAASVLSALGLLGLLRRRR